MYSAKVKNQGSDYQYGNLNFHTCTMNVTEPVLRLSYISWPEEISTVIVEWKNHDAKECAWCNLIFVCKAVTFMFVHQCICMNIYVGICAFIHVCIWLSVHGEKYRWTYSKFLT